MASLESYPWASLGKTLWSAVSPFLTDVYSAAYDDANRTLPVDVAFDVTNPRVKDALKQREKLIKGVADNIFEGLKGLVERQSEEGQSPAALAKAIREYGITDSKSRSTTIARTESATALNTGHILAYEDAGVERVKVLDGDGDEECASADGEIWTLEEAMANPVAHPNCTRSFVPVIDSGKAQSNGHALERVEVR